MMLRGTCDTSIYFCQFPIQLAHYVLPLVIGPPLCVYIYIYIYIYIYEGIFSGFQNIIVTVSVCLHLTLQTLLFPYLLA